MNIDAFRSKDASIAVVGLGYVGLPLAVEFAKLYSVAGFDISDKKIEELSNNVDVTGEVSTQDLEGVSISFTTSLEDIRSANVYIVTVPTPIDDNQQPDLTAVKKATESVGSLLSQGDVVVYESTVYPGVTEEVCVPILEKASGLSFNSGFFIGYSPERISPGEKERTLTKITKIVSGSTPEALDFLDHLYSSIVTAGIYRASSIMVAEAAKVIENTQRDLNVALMNELSIIFNKLGINTLDVIDAAATKWNFMRMVPGLVGGHCIGVDPYYLTFRAQQLGYHPEVILSGRRINDGMGKYIAEQTVKSLIKAQKPVRGAKVLVMGLSFKENVPDVRNTKVVDILHELHDYGVECDVYDPLADASEAHHEYGISPMTTLDFSSQYAAIVYAIQHEEFKSISFEQLAGLISGNTPDEKVFIDVKGIFNHQDELTSRVNWWCL